MSATIQAAHALMQGVALALGLDAKYFARTYTAEPTVLFRIFRYPPQRSADDERWGVGEHTDYGLLTLLAQDAHGGLQVGTRGGWIDAPPLAGTLVCNIGDMLDRLTGAISSQRPTECATPADTSDCRFPLFFDPDFAARIQPLPRHASIDERLIDEDRARRWDRASVHEFSGTYGDYLLSKVVEGFSAASREGAVDLRRARIGLSPRRVRLLQHRRREVMSQLLEHRSSKFEGSCCPSW
jgi:isopenicillin N synthase-like dioxygenase